jgi:hypothetical protein
MRFAGAGSADQDGVALLGQECPCRQTADQAVVRQSGWEGSDNQDEKPGVATLA